MRKSVKFNDKLLGFMDNGFLFFLFFFLAIALRSQTTSVYVLDVNNVPIEGVYVYFETSGETKITNEKGLFLIKEGGKKESAIFSKLGFVTLNIKMLGEQTQFYLKKDKSLGQLAEVVVDRNSNFDLNSVSSGKVILTSKQIEKQPYILGEQDVFKLIQLTPGVQQAKEGQSGFLVRGGNASMNLTLIDNSYLHNTSHLGGFFSAVNSDLIESVEFSKSAFDAKYGGRLASVTSIATKNKPDAKNEFKGSIGFLTSKLTGNLNLSNQTQLLFSGRRTYLELFEPFFKNSSSILGKEKKYFFYDYLIKVNHQLNEKHQVSIFGYHTKDEFKDYSENRNRIIDWGNLVSGITWKYKISDDFRVDNTISASNYEFKLMDNEFPYAYDFTSNLEILSLKSNFTLLKDKSVTSFGLEFANNSISPKKVNAKILDVPLVIDNQIQINYNEINLFVDYKYDFNEKLKAKFGIRLGAMFLEENALMGTHEFVNVEPRFNINYRLTTNNSLKFSYQYLNQYLHQASISSFSLPLDYLLVSNSFTKPQKGNLISLGWVNSNDLFDVSLSGYFNYIDNYTEFKSGAVNSLFSNNIYEDVVQGQLQSYGVELGIKGEISKIDYSLSTTISKTEALFNEINDGVPFRTTFDRPLNLNLIANYELNERFSFSATFVYNSGQNFTPPRDIRIINEDPVINYGTKNSETYPDYHRLDLSCTYSFKTENRFKSKLNLTIYNAYNNKNPFFINYKTNNADFGDTIFIEKENENLFPIIPTLNWIFTF